MDNKSYHIIIIASWYKSQDMPTSGSFIEEQARLLQKNGHKVSVLHPYLKGTFFGTISNRKNILHEYNDNGIITINIGIAPVLPKLRVLNYRVLSKKCQLNLQNYINKYGKPDIIHSHSMFMGGVIAMDLSLKYKIPHVHTEHSSGLIFNPNQYNKSDIRVLKSVFSNAKKTLFVSQFALEKTLEQFKINNSKCFEVIPNLVNDDFFSSELKEPIGIRFSYLIICNLIPIKQVDLLVNSWVKLLEIFPNSSLTICGEGPERNKLNNLVRDLKLESTISLLPKLNRNQVKDQIQSHHVLVSSSQLETFGLTVAEAQSMGKPVVTTDSGGVRDIVTNESGIITSQSTESLTQGLILIQKHYNEFSQQEIRQKAKLKFSSEPIYNQLINIYREVNCKKKNV